jgi:tetratricopeptide (TPR) repeat protein
MSFGKELKLLEKEHYTLQAGQWDARKSEMTALTKKVHPLLHARSLIMRGKLHPAKALLEELGTLKTSDHDLVEVDLENARVANAHAKWDEAIKLATLALGKQPSPVSTHTFLQIRALAYFEQGRFSETLVDLQDTELLCEAFPKSCSGFYAKILKAKTLARTRSLEAGRAELNLLWQTGEINSDLLLTLIRAEIDIRRLEQGPTLDLSICSHYVAYVLGDLLYQGLALVDVFYSLDHEGQRYLKNAMEKAKKKFVRIHILCDEIESNSPKSVTAQTIQNFKGFLSVPPFSEESLCEAPKAILFSKARRLFNFDLNRCCIPDSEKMELALSLLAKKTSIGKSDFFKTLWGNQKYLSRLHDSLIGHLLSRMRKDLSLDLAIEGSNVILKSKIEILAL